MKLHCFAGFWTRRTIGEEDQISTSSSPWIISGVDQDKVKVLQPQSLMAKQTEDLRGVVKSKSDKHRNYFKSLVGTCNGDQPIIQGNTQMAQPKQVANNIQDTDIKIKNESKRQRRLGVYEREAFDNKTHQEEIIFKSVKQLRNQYLAMLDDKTIVEQKPKELLALPPQSDYASSSGTSDDEKTTWHRKHKVTRCGSSDSAMGQSDDEPQISPYSPRGSIDHSNVPSKIIIQAQTVLCPVDRKSSISMDCVSEDNDFDSRRQSCFTDDGDEVPRYRYWRTPSVVVSDYSDDIMGLTLEDIEYIRSRKEASSSTDSSLHSSCSNLNYCGSTISGLDSEFVLTKPYRKSSNCSTCSTLSGDEDQETNFESSTAKSTLRPAGRPREMEVLLTPNKHMSIKRCTLTSMMTSVLTRFWRSTRSKTLQYCPAGLLTLFFIAIIR
ncbi:unnamed protein product [Ceutorhynchus assimilis]|uniref:Uncharacterized protein n=1 Tax=Ceutorhynchus assimilis TaxID=467358 RepID=A0A9P0DHF9_9CUCU|nr:unnamed protein product [Ceutorhynchus assimilis]